MSATRTREILSRDEVTAMARKLKAILGQTTEWENLRKAETDLVRILPFFRKGGSVVSELRETISKSLAVYEAALKERFTISFAGASKMGKSSLVNALVGFRLLHYQNDVDTMGITFIRCAPKGAVPKLYLADTSGNPVSGPIAEGEINVFTKIGELHAEIKRRYDYDPKSAVNEALPGEFLLIVSPMLLAEGLPSELKDTFQLVDTPGPDKAGNNRRVSQVSWDQNARSHLTVALVTARDGGTTRAQDVFKMYAAVREENKRSLYPHIKDDSPLNPLFVAVTNFDLVGESEADETLETVRRHISAYLRPAGKAELPFCKARVIPCIPREMVWATRIMNGEDLEGDDLSQMLQVCFGVKSRGKTMMDLRTAEGKLEVQALYERSNVATIVRKLREFILTKSYPMIVSKHSAIVSSANDYALDLTSRVIKLCNVLSKGVQGHISQGTSTGQALGKQLFGDIQKRLRDVATRVEAGNLQFIEEAELFVHLANSYQTSVTANKGSFAQINTQEAKTIIASLTAVSAAVSSLFKLDEASLATRLEGTHLS